MNTESSSGFARQRVEQLSSRLRNEKRELVQFLVELADFDRNQLALELGYPSTLGCLVRELGLTESSACRRIAAARLLARFPQIAPHLFANRVTVTGLVALREVLDETNVDEVLERASGLSEPAVRQLVERMRFAADPTTPVEVVSAGQLALATAPAAAVAADEVATPSCTEVTTEPEALEVVTLRVGREFFEELEAVRRLLSHAVPGGKKEDVLLHVLRIQRKQLERRRHGSQKRKSAPVAAGDTRHIPAAVRREVFEREGGTCAFVGEEGRRCGSSDRLEYQHIVPFACGGPSTPENITLFCQPHNLLQAKKDFGEDHVTEKRAVSALTRLGYPRAQAELAVRAASKHRPDLELPALVRESLRVADRVTS
jgi:5-methylcytosine-specific restriction endonuclease McrA